VQLVEKQYGLAGKFGFVGTQRSSCAGIGSNGGHEGYPAIKATKAESGPKSMGGAPWDQNKLPPIMARLHPDVVMILLGVNDMVTSKPSFCVLRHRVTNLHGVGL